MYYDNDMYYDNYMNYCEKEAEKMYPEVCRKLSPYVKRKCNQYDNQYNKMMNPFPNREMVNKMVDEIEEEYKKDNGHLENPEENHNLTRQRGRFGRDLITVLLLGELLGRRHRRFRRPRRRPFGYGGYGGYGGGFGSPFF